MEKIMWHWPNLRQHISIFLEEMNKTIKILPEWTVCGARFETWNLQNIEKCYQLDRDILQWSPKNITLMASHTILLKSGAVHLVKNTKYVDESTLLE
jgi:hypothetical protein